MTQGSFRRPYVLSSVIVPGTSDTLSPNAQVTYTGYFAIIKNQWRIHRHGDSPLTEVELYVFDARFSK
ncbi:MAG: hypothetical protein ABSD89_02505 [Halobacteriota archaeon]